MCSRTINTSFVERQHATDQGQNARKARRTYRFSKGLAPNKLVVWCYNQLDSFRSNDGGELWSPSHPITEPSISVVVPIANKVGEATLLRSIELSIN